jgi:hypothetical protein
VAIPGTAEGDLIYVDLGPGPAFDGGLTGLPVCPPTYYAPRLLDQNDYTNPFIPPSLVTIQAVDPQGVLLGTPPVDPLGRVLVQTASGTPVPVADRTDAGFPTVTNPDGTLANAVDCYALVPGTVEICVTDGLVQHGVAETEIVSVVYEGVINNMPTTGTLIGDQLSVNPGYYGCADDGGAGGGPSCDLTTNLEGLLIREMANLTVELNLPGQGPCGDYAVTRVLPTSMTLAPQPSPAPAPNCRPGPVAITTFASGAKPYTVTGTFTGFQTQLWSADGRLQLVKHPRWQYPANLTAMERSAQQLADVTFGVPSGSPVPPAPGTLVPPPTPQDYDALDSAFSLALIGGLGPVSDGGIGLDGGLLDGGLLDGGLLDGGLPTWTPLRGSSYRFVINSGVLQVAVNPLDISAMISGMASYTDILGIRHVYASYQGGSALIELNPEFAYYQYLYETH